jgi:CheY-like chemotaxis protein
VARIAIAEPHDEIRQLVAAIVSALGHEPVDARDLGDGAPADVLVLEPGDGAALQLAIRLRREQPDLPVIIVSIYGPTHATRALDPVAFLPKPFTLTELEHAIDIGLDSSR